MKELILPYNDDVTPSGACSRCGMAYGVWELTLTWTSSKESKPFIHLPGCQWKMPNHKKDFGPQLRRAGVVPSNANIIRMK